MVMDKAHRIGLLLQSLRVASDILFDAMRRAGFAIVARTLVGVSPGI